jgi:DNA-binding transcriptional regulator YiaG
MDKRYKALSPQEMLSVRRQVVEDLAATPELPIPLVIRKIRTSLRYTIAEYAKLCGVSARTLSEIERGTNSPTLATVEKLLKPMGMVAGAVSASASRESN